MNLTDYRAVLKGNQFEIERRLFAHMLHDKRIKHNKDSFEVEFNRIIDNRMENWITTATCPEVTDEAFDAVAYFVAGKTRLYESVLRVELLKLVAQRAMTQLTAEEWGVVESEENLEEEVMDKLIKEEVRRANVYFATNVEGVDKTVFHAGQRGYSARRLAETLWGTPADTSKVNKATYMLSAIIFRYACYAATCGIFTEEVLLRGLNDTPKMVKRHFGVDKLTKLPQKETLMKVAFTPEEKKSDPNFVPKTTSWKKISKVDFNGKEHDHFVVFSNGHGTLYDHVTKTTRKE